MCEDLIKMAVLGELTELQFRQLEKLLSADDEARKKFFHCCQLEVDLHILFHGLPDDPDWMKRSPASPSPPATGASKATRQS